MPEMPMSVEERLERLERMMSKLRRNGGDYLMDEGYLQIGDSGTNGSHRFDLRGYQMANNGADGFGIGAAGMWFVPYLHPLPQVGASGVYPQTVISGFARPSDSQTQLTIRGQTALNDNLFNAIFIANPSTASIQLEVDSASNDSVALVLSSPDSGDPAAYIQVGSTIYDLLGGGGGMPMPVILSPVSPQAIGVEIASRDTTTPASAAYPTANKAILYPFYVSEDITIDKLWCYNGATANGNVDIGIYTEAFSRVVSIGPTAQSGTSGLQEFDITNTPLSRGTYYMALSHSNTTGTYTRLSTTSAALASMGCAMQTGAGTLPATITPAAPADAYMPLFGWSRRSLVA